VAYSVFNYRLWWGWKGPENWRWGILPRELSTLWENHQKSFLALAAIQWIILEEAFSKAIEKCRKIVYCILNMNIYVLLLSRFSNK
jgi:hypothetical protein